MTRSTRWPGPLPGVALAAAVTVGALTAAPAVEVRPAEVVATAPASCAPLDVAVVLDTSTSMDGAIGQVKDQVMSFVDEVGSASGGDYRMGLVDFASYVNVQVTFAPGNGQAVRDALVPLRQTRSNVTPPESWDEALATVVDNRAEDPTVEGIRQVGDFTTPWRPEANRIVVLVTDALPGGFDDRHSPEDIDAAYAAAGRAAAAGIKVVTVFVPNGDHQDEAVPVLAEVAAITGAPAFTTLGDGSNLTEGLSVAVQSCAADADGDGLFDAWETDGVDVDGDGTIDLDLPRWGADPAHKDLFVQVNWMDPAGEEVCRLMIWCPPRPDLPPLPDPGALRAVAAVFADAPVDNPDGEPGVDVHIDAGHLSPKGTVMPLDDRRGGPIDVWADVLASDADGGLDHEEILGGARRSTFEERADVATWVVYVNRIGDGPLAGLLGWATAIPTDTAYISGALMTGTWKESLTVTHELGHTLGLRHGGRTHLHGMPNYRSIMNYDFALVGLAGIDGTRVIDYSDEVLDTLDELDGLDETVGIGPATAAAAGATVTYRCLVPAESEDSQRTMPAVVGQPVDWNCDGDQADTGLSGVIHDTPSGQVHRRARLVARDDWATLNFTGGERGGLRPESEDLDEDGFDEAAWQAEERDVDVEVRGPGRVAAVPGAALHLVAAVKNLGASSDTYRASATIAGDWTGPEVPAGDPLTVAPGQQSVLEVAVTVPEDAQVGEVAWVQMTVSSDALGGDPAAVEGVEIVVADVRAPHAADGPLVLDPALADPGAEVTATGEGFLPGTTVVADLPDGPQRWVVTDDGQVAGTFDAPDAPGSVTVRAVGAGPAGAPTPDVRVLTGVLAIRPPAAVPARDAAPVSTSGTSTMALAILAALGAVVLGAGVLGARRARRRRTRAR